jgi:GH25 family lysozyme M1 (1,4-beta-N-acetylmuramidase)
MKKTNLKKILALLLAMVLVFSLFACGKKEEPEPDEPDIGEVDNSPTITISLKQLLELVSSSWTMTELVTRMFPDYIAYMVDDEEVAVAEKKQDVPMLSKDLSKITTDNYGFKTYDAGSGVKQSWKGIDVSEHQGEIDWKMVADSGIEFVFVRLGYRGYETGKFVKDKNFDDNVKGAIENGIGVGVYFVPQAVTVDEAKEEADFVIENIKEYDINWPVVYDVEPSSSGKGRADSLSTQQYTDQIKAFCDRIQEAGYKPMVYSNTKWFVSKMDLSKLSGIDLWYAYYGKGFYFPYDFKVWQFSNTGSVNGIKGNVDQNISFVNYGAQ